MLPLGLLIPLLVAAAAAPAQGPPPDATSILLVNAVPGAGAVEVRVNGAGAGSADYGATRSLPAPAGRTELEVTFPEGATPSPGQLLPRGAVVAASKRLEADGTYTALALPAEGEGGVRLRFLRTGPESDPAAGKDGDGVPGLTIALAVAGGAALGMGG